jgi:hypothetical protein
LLTITAISGISGVLVTNNGTSHIVSLNDPSIQLSDITDLTNNAKTFLLTPSSNNLSALLSDETGSGVLVFNNSPTFTGIPLTPTANAGTNNTQIASTAFVRTEISNLVASAPSTLDTLNELATALGNDPNFATTITNNLAGKANLSDATFTGSISGPSGNFVSLKVNNVDVSASGHSHTSSNITDFNSSVSGLLPVKDIIGGSGISIGSVSGTYTVTAFGVAASSASSLTTEVYNSTASTIPKGSVVYIDGGHGNLPTVSLAIANGESGSSKTYGITATNISSNNNGNVVVIGSLIDFDTNQFGAVEGTTLYLSPSISGAMTTTKPVAPNHLVSVGKIVRNHSTQGVIQVNIQNGFELGELHNVATNETSDGQFLRYNYSSGLWIPSSSGNFTSLSVNNTGVSVNGHTHSSSDITNFNSSVSGLLSPYQLVLTNPVTGTGVANHIAYWNSSSGIVADSGQLYWDATNNRLGIGITSPLDLIHISGSTASSVGIRFDNNDGHGGSVQADNGQLYLNSSTATAARLSGRKIRLGDGGASACALELGSVGTISQDGNGGGLSFSGTTGQFSNGLHVTAGNVGIGTTTPNQKLDVNGNVNIDGNLTFDSFTESVVTIGNSSTSQTISLTSGTVQTCTLTGNCTFTMPTATAGKSFTLFLNSGAGNFTATFTGVRWADSATPTATILANKVDIFSFISDGTYWYGSFSQNYG